MAGVSERKLEETIDMLKDIEEYIISLMKKAESKHKGRRFNFIDVRPTRGVDLCYYGFDIEEVMKIRYRFFLEKNFKAEQVAKGYYSSYILTIEATIVDMVYHPEETYGIKDSDDKIADTISLRPIDNPVYKELLCEDLIRKSKEANDYYNDIRGILEEVLAYIKMYHKKLPVSIFSTYDNISVFKRDVQGKPEQYREYFMDQAILAYARKNYGHRLEDILDCAKKYGLDLKFNKEEALKHIEYKKKKGYSFIGPDNIQRNAVLLENLGYSKNREYLLSIEKAEKLFISPKPNNPKPTESKLNEPKSKKETYADGAWYEGEFKNGVRHGQGTFCWTNGIKYVGPFVNGTCHGEGILYYTDGTSSKVIYDNGKVVSTLPNIIKETYSDGAWYEGEFKNGVRHGQGTFCWTNGIKYVGPFVNGLCHGEGILYYTDGTSKKSIYENGSLKELLPNNIRKNYADGAWYDGEFKNDYRHGQGTFYWTNGTKYIGSWFDGDMHGEGIIYYNDGSKESVICFRGKIINRETIK